MREAQQLRSRRDLTGGRNGSGSKSSPLAFARCRLLDLRLRSGRQFRELADGYSNERLLRRAGRQEERLGRGNSQGIPQASPQISPRRQSRRQKRRRKIQSNLGGERGSQRSQEAQDLRPT